MAGHGRTKPFPQHGHSSSYWALKWEGGKKKLSSRSIIDVDARFPPVNLEMSRDDAICPTYAADPASRHGSLDPKPLSR